MAYYFMFHDDGTMYHISDRVMKALENGAAFPQFAGKTLPVLGAYAQRGEKQKIVRLRVEHSAMHLTFDVNGRVDYDACLFSNAGSSPMSGPTAEEKQEATPYADRIRAELVIGTTKPSNDVILVPMPAEHPGDEVFREQLRQLRREEHKVSFGRYPEER